MKFSLPGRLSAWLKSIRELPDPFLLRSLATVLLLLLFLYLGYEASSLAYRKIRSHIFSNRIDQAMEKEDWKQAYFYLQLNLKRDPGSLRNLHQMIRLGEEVNAPWVVEWRKLLHRRDPRDTENRLSLAQNALRNGQLNEARNLASDLPETPALAASQENILALIALHEKKTDQAGIHFKKALEHSPDSTVALGNYLFFLISSRTDSPETGSLLEKLAKTPKGKVIADRCHLSLLLKKGEKAEALALSSELSRSPGHSFSDVLANLGLVLAHDRGRYDQALTEASVEASQKTKNALRLLAFLDANGQRGKALRTLEGWDSKLKQQPGLLKKKAELLYLTQDWTGLHSFTSGEAWKGNSPQRFAYLSEACRKLQKETDSLYAREKAMQLTRDSPMAQFQLLELISSWPHWRRQTEELLWDLSKKPAFEKSSLNALFSLYQQQRNALGLQKVSDRLLGLFPDSLLHQNNAVSLALLNDLKTSWAMTKAKSLYVAHPDNPFVICTYAFALHKEGKKQESLKVIRKIPEPLLLKTPFNFYYAVILMNCGEKEMARKIGLELDSKTLLDKEESLWTAESLAN